MSYFVVSGPVSTTMNVLTLEKNKIISNLEDFFKQNASHYCLEVVLLYGSWAQGLPREDSDIDLAVSVSDTSIHNDEIFSLITDISYALQVKLNREVNVIYISKDFSHPCLYYNAIILGIPIFTRDAEQLLNLKLEAIHQMEDFRIFGLSWQKQIAKDLIYREKIFDNQERPDA